MAELLHRLFETADKFDASDIHLTREAAPYFRIAGKIVSSKMQPLSQDDIHEVIEPTLSDDLKARYEERGYVDYAYETLVAGENGEHRVRYRMHLYRSRGGMTAALRRIGSELYSFKKLHLPDIYEKVMRMRPKGIIIIGGETGSGKSTTLGAMVNYINQREEKHIVTVEDPIEYVIDNIKCKINQRELGYDFTSYTEALRAVVREDPDVIMIGEMRDGETVRAAIAAAETGHLVLTSLHTATVTETFHRILYFFPPNEEEGVRQNLSSTLIAIMNQMLLPCLDDVVKTKGIARVPATEVLVNTSIVRECLRDKEKEHDLGDIVTSGTDDMHDFNMSLMRLFDEGYIHREAAVAASLRPEGLRMMFKGVR